MVKRLALVAICFSCLTGNALAQDAKAVIANAQKHWAIPNPSPIRDRRRTSRSSSAAPMPPR